MSEQIITILLSTLLGGVLTIAGGLVVNYINHKQMTTYEQRKELREVVEKIYKLSLDIDAAYNNALEHGGDIKEMLNDMKYFVNAVQDITMLVSFYAPDLANETQEFTKILKPRLIEDYANRRLGNEEYSKQCMIMYNENMKYRQQLAAFLRKNAK